MRLGSLFEDIQILEKMNWHPLVQVGKITSDSRMISAGDVFVACRGARMDGHDFLAQAIQAKASCVVFEDLLDLKLPSQIVGVKVSDTSLTLCQLLQNAHGHPDHQLKLIGVTGTNGKTTIAYLLHLLLREHIRSAYVGTLWYDLPHQKLAAVNTTPGPEIFIPLLKNMVEERVEACIMEVSSHALSQRRIAGIGFEVAIFTQLTQDHLDYHANFEDYFQAKRLLFSQKPAPRKMLINIDCPYGKRLAAEFPDAKTVSLQGPADYQITDPKLNFYGSRFTLNYRGREVSFQIRLPFRHNLYNVAEVLAALDLLGYDPEDFRGLLQEVPGIPGRMERVSGTESFQIFVDYAHTPDAVENVLSQSRHLNPSRVITVLGCGGDRDRGKRPLMGKIAAQYSDIVFLTSDNPRSEDPESILREIQKGAKKSAADSTMIHTIADRREAIERAVQSAQQGDVVLILGKGHEDYQIIGNQKLPFDDRKVAQECLKRSSRAAIS